jgi:hypothetical protein
MLLPAFAAALGVITALFFVGRPEPASRPVPSNYPSKRNVGVAL